MSFGKIELGATLSNAKLSHLVFGYGAHQRSVPTDFARGPRMWGESMDGYGLLKFILPLERDSLK